MPFKKVIPFEINRKFAIRFSTPTQDIANIDTFKKYFSQECAYNIIPGFENTSLIDVESFLLQILPLTTNSILDITLPFIEITKKKNVIKHLGRYIIVDRMLFGIRIKISDNWPKSRNIKIPISANIQHFYDQNYITNYPREITVGQFILATKNFKLAPLFTSQLSSLLDNNTYNLLNDYYYLGCEIFSIVNDLTEEKRKTLKDPFDIFKNYRRDTTIFVYCGMHLNVDSAEIYKTKSYAIQTSDRLKKIYVTKLDQTYHQTFIVDFNLTKKNKRITEFDASKMINSEIETVDCNSIRIKHCFEKIDFHAIGRFQEPMEIQEEQNELKIKENELLMYLWNLYVKFNNRKPFILPLPMNKKEEILLIKILQLQDVTNLQKTDLVNFIKLDPKAKLPKKYELFNFRPLILQRLPINDNQLFPIYFPLKERILSNNIEKDERFLQDVEKKIVNCLGCISDEMFKSLENETAAQKIQVMDEDQKFIERFLKKKNISLEMFYFDMAKYYPLDKLTQEFIQTMYESLKLITKRQINGSPFQAFILKKSYEEIHHIFIESQRKFLLNPIKKEEQPEAQPAQNAQNNFRSHIKKVAYHVFAQKKSHYTCHLCLGLFNKKISNTYGRMCLGCNNYVCYACFDKRTGQIAQSQQQFQQCLVCQNKCDCEKCMKKRFKNNDMPSRMSFFKSSNNLNSSCENIRIEEEPSILNENNRTHDNVIKTENSDKIQNKSALFKTNSAPLEEQITIQRCWTCELQNRLERIIRFQCSNCKSEKCLDCEKSQNPKRIWVLRGKRLCNKCLYEEQQAIFKQTENKNLKSKIIALEHEIVLLKRHNFILNPSASAQQNNPFGDYAIVQEINDNEQESNQQNKLQIGGLTPIFERSSTGNNKEGQSPISVNGRQNSIEVASNASFGGQNMQTNRKRKNSSKSSGSGSNKSKKTSSPKKNNDLKQTKAKRKNSSGSEISGASFKQRKRSNSNSSKGSEKKKPKARNSSAESGEYQESSSENYNKKPEQKKDWKWNHHQNTDQPNYNDNNRGGYRPRGDRGGSRGGNRQFDNNRQGGGQFKKWDNNRDNNRDFRGRNDDRRGSNNRFNNDDRQGGGFNNRFNNNNDDRQGGGFNNRYNNNDNQGGYNNNRFNNNDRQGGFNNRNNNFQDRDNSSYNDDRNNQSRDDGNKKKQGLLFTSSNASINNDEDMDY